jgi:hypothetical protein
VYADENLALVRLWVGHFGGDENLGSTVVIDDDGVHDVFLLSD